MKAYGYNSLFLAGDKYRTQHTQTIEELYKLSW